MSISKQIAKLTKYIRDNEYVYVSDKLTVHLMKDLPSKYYIKDNLIVENPFQYLSYIHNREPTKNELSQFILVKQKIRKMGDIIYDDIVPAELIKKSLTYLSLNQILMMRTLSKEYMNIIDTMWYDLMKRDYPNEIFDKTIPFITYKFLFCVKRMPNITLDLIMKKIEWTFRKPEELIPVIEAIGFIRHHDTWYFNPKRIFKCIDLQNLLSGFQFIRSIELFDGKKYAIENEMIMSHANTLFYKVSQVLPEKFHICFNETGKTFISHGYAFKMYESVYGKGSFDEDFMSTISERNKKKFLDHFHDVAK